MSVVANSVNVRAQLNWRLTKTVTGFDAASQGPGGLSATASPATATFSAIYHLATTSIAAAGTLNLDLYSFTDLVGDAITATKICGLLITASAAATGGQLKIEPAATNPLNWPIAAAGSITLTVGTTGAGLLVWQGTAQVMSATARGIKLSNPGTVAVSVTVAAVVGP